MVIFVFTLGWCILMGGSQSFFFLKIILVLCINNPNFLY